MEKSHKGRFTVLFLFSLQHIMCAMGFLSFGSINEKLKFAYNCPNEHISKWQLDYVNSCFMIIYVPMSLVSSWYIETYCIRKCVIVGSLFSLIGFILRTFISQSFIYVIVGQTIMAVGYPFILNMPAKISAQWFKKEARLFTTMTGTNMCLIGYISVYDLSN